MNLNFFKLDFVLAVGGVGANREGHADTEVFNVASKEWIKLESIGFVSRVINAPIVWSNDAFYIIGGRTHWQADLARKLDSFLKFQEKVNLSKSIQKPQMESSNSI